MPQNFWMIRSQKVSTHRLELFETDNAKNNKTHQFQLLLSLEKILRSELRDA